MIAIAFAAHLLVLGVSVFIGEFSVRPPTPPEAYTVEVVSDGELGGHMPSGLPKVDLGGEEPPKKVAKAAPKAEPPPPKPEPKPEPPPEPEPQPEPPAPPPPEPAKAAEPEPKEAPQPEPPADLKPAEEGDLVVATATPTAAPTARPTARPTPKPTAKPTPKPTAKPTAAPTAAPTATPRATGAAATARPSAAARPTPTPLATAAAGRTPKPSPGRSPGEAPKPTFSPVIVVKSRPTPDPDPNAPRGPQAGPTSEADARIQAALERVQRKVGQEPRGGAPSGANQGGVRAPGGDPRGSGGVGGTDAYDPNRRIGMGGPGRGGAGEVRGTEFLLYYNQMLARIREAWVYTGGATTAEVKVHFRINDDGAISDLRVVQPSGDAPYDASVLRAVRGASPLAPPPEKYRGDFADVELTFKPGDLKAPR